MRYIKTPFNFVPVSSQVYFPDWADQISHDVPFSDGLSGQLSLEIEAKTPVFIRDSEEKTRFCHIKDKDGHERFFIPGTSLKGILRSVVEILSFGKMEKINDDKYAIRDLRNSTVYNLMTDSANIHCGWLKLIIDKKGNESATIRDCGHPWRISHRQLDFALRTDFVNTFKEGGRANFSNPEHKTAGFKYNTVAGGISLTYRFAKTTAAYGKLLCDFDAAGKQGTLVFTGQAGARRTAGRPSGKFYEFVFIDPPSTSQITVSSKIWKEFKFHYFDNDPKHISADWKWRKSQLEAGDDIPVFFRIDASDPTQVRDLGLAYLYKMPYEYSVKDRLPKEHRLPFLDMADCIFGDVNETDALKGRVQIQPAWADIETVHETGAVNTILGTPKASYYPIYIKQAGNGGVVDKKDGKPRYKTFMDKDAELRGRKRYVTREQIWNELPPPSEKMKVEFTPLEAETKFTAKVNYFNLRPAEFGALLSAITFHNNAGLCYHGLGMAKPYGFGRVSVKITKGINDGDLIKYLAEFESEVTASMEVDEPGFSWGQSEAIKQFMALSKLQRIEDARMGYMELRDFADAKKNENGFYLQDYSTLSGDFEGAKSLITGGINEEKKVRAEIVRKQVKEEINTKAKEEVLHENELAEKERLIAEEKRRKEQEEVQKIRLAAMAKEKEAIEKREAEERLRLETLQKEMEQREAEEKARIEERNRQLKEGGLEPRIRDVNDFKTARKAVDFYMKHIDVNHLNEQDTNSLMEKADGWYYSTRDKDREKRWKPLDGPDWKKLASWVGEEIATDWYNKIGEQK